VNAPAGWDRIVAYAAGKAAKPPRAEASQVLDELLEALPVSRCTYHSEVFAALLRRPPLRIPASGFGFRGAGISYETSSGVPLPGFRSDDLVTIRHAGGSKNGELDWHHTRGAEHVLDEELVVSVGPGEWISYDIEIAEPASIDLVVALGGSRESEVGHPALEIAVDGDGLRVEAAGGGDVRATTKGPLAAGRHVVRLTGLAEESLVRSIDVTLATR
jgi:hypothetical protein